MPPGNDEDVGVGDLLERGVDGDAEHAVLGADLAALVADEHDVDVGDALQHLVGPDRVERGEPGNRAMATCMACSCCGSGQ